VEADQEMLDALDKSERDK
jgi:sugar-specific transcriptional regulator TrmB